MPKKTKIIFITVFLLVGVILLGIYFYNKSRGVKVEDPNTSLYQKFNPFGTSSNVNNTTSTEPGTTEGETPNQPVSTKSRLTKLTDFAVSGATFFEEEKLLPDGTTSLIPSLKYVERETGHVYQMSLETKSIGKVSNSTIPGVYEAIFNDRANSVIYRYASSDNKSITSFLATFGGKSNFLNSDILQISLSPDKSKFFSLTKNKSGATGVIKSFDGTKTNQVFTSSFSEWLPQWVIEQNVFLTTKPSYLVEGSIFLLNTTNGTLSKLFGGIAGLTTLANSTGDLVLYGASLSVGPKLNVFNIKNHTSIDLDKYGLPEKCIWSNDNINVFCAIPNTVLGTQYPDYWYQGLVSFEDRFIKMNTLTKEASTLANSEEETPVDAINMFLDNKEDKLFFVNKKDYTLWQLDL